MRLSLAYFAVLALPAFAEPPVIENVRASNSSDTWSFDVTISHPDTGWDHYVDAWRVVDMEGAQIAIRNLAHPHVNEQPFTRSVSGVRLPDGTEQVQIQARDNIGGWSPDMKVVKLK